MGNIIEEITINNVVYKVGDKVWYGLNYNTENQVTFTEGFVAFGKFFAEIYTCYGFYVTNEQGDQVSEAGLTGDYIIVKS